MLVVTALGSKAVFNLSDEFKSKENNKQHLRAWFNCGITSLLHIFKYSTINLFNKCVLIVLIFFRPCKSY